jgi:hypothetical protein
MKFSTGADSKVEYYHVELESHDVIIAEGAFSESFFDDDSRAMFHNAHEYYSLYPGPRSEPAQYCAPRLQEGFEIDAARRKIALRAGLLREADMPWIGPLRGFVDDVSSLRIAGWVQNVENREAPVCLDIYAGGRLIGQTLANRFREDLLQAGLGNGRHAFAFMLPPWLTFEPDAVRVRRSLDGTALEFAADLRPAVQPLTVATTRPPPNVTVHRRSASG